MSCDYVSKQKKEKDLIKEVSDVKKWLDEHPLIRKKYEEMAEEFEPWKQGYECGLEDGHVGVIKEIKKWIYDSPDKNFINIVIPKRKWESFKNDKK